MVGILLLEKSRTSKAWRAFSPDKEQSELLELSSERMVGVPLLCKI